MTYIAYIAPERQTCTPPVHAETIVNVIYDDRDYDNNVSAGNINWSRFGDGPKLIAYEVVEEYTPPKVPREWWLVGHVAKESEADAARFLQELQHDHPGMFDAHHVIHVREVAA